MRSGAGTHAGRRPRARRGQAQREAGEGGWRRRGEGDREAGPGAGGACAGGLARATRLRSGQLSVRNVPVFFELGERPQPAPRPAPLLRAAAGWMDGEWGVGTCISARRGPRPVRPGRDALRPVATVPAAPGPFPAARCSGLAMAQRRPQVWASA